MEISENKNLHPVLELLDLEDPKKIYEVFLNDYDQPLMKSGEWDYKNPELMTNKIVEAVEYQELPEAPEERLWVLWLYYHHAISVAIHRYKDRERAMEFSEKALRYQPEDSQNKITKLLHLLLRDQIDEARKLVDSIENYEKPTAESIINDYKNWFK